MPGPKTATEALAWIQDAVTGKRYIPDPHFDQQAAKRRFSIFDAKKIIATATSCVPYIDHKPRANGTGWRVTGTALDGTTAKLGVEAYKDHLGRHIILITIMDD